MQICLGDVHRVLTHNILKGLHAVMLFKEKLYLANCDSTRRLSREELHKRFMTAVVFADGVVFSPNVLIDNPGILDMLSGRRVAHWFQEEGLGSVVVRGVGVHEGMSLVEYFDQLPGDYVVSRLGGRTKQQLEASGKQELDALRLELEHTQQQLMRYQAGWETLKLTPESLTQEILKRYRKLWDSKYFAHDTRLLDRVREQETVLPSRSAWYQHLEGMTPGLREHFKWEVVDVAYGRLFVKPGEAFAMDRIKYLSGLPETILQGGLGIRAMRKQREWISQAYGLFGLVTSLATEELLRVLADEAIGFLEDKALDRGLDWACRDNWFGLYDKVTAKIGVELTE